MFFRWKTRQIKSKIRHFQIFENISFIKKAITFDKIGGNHALSSKFYKNMLIRVFLHAEFKSAMKTVQIPTIFVKNAKK